MYALKFVTKDGIHNYSLGSEYHIQRENPVESTSPTDIEGPIAIVTGADKDRGWEVWPNSGAYITTIDGKTVEVVNRIVYPS
ncbi:MAG: hypothetical protein RSD49_21560 [Hafnia sp.]